MEFSRELHLAIIAAQQASKAVMALYKQTTIECTHKASDHSPLTQADLESNTLICQLLQANFSYPILSEENKDDLSRLPAQRIWVIDPLDGTKEFLAENGEFTINIALVEFNRPVLGIIACPVKESVFYACAGNGAYQLEHNQARKIQVINKPSVNDLKIAVSRSHLSPELIKILQTLDNYQLVSCGSALKYCSVANGSLDATLRKSPLCEWDIAAADCILHEANGVMTNFDGAVFSYNQPNPQINSGIIASNKLIYPTLFKLIQ